MGSGYSPVSDKSKAAIEARLLSGEPFTFGEVVQWANREFADEQYREVDKAIQRLRRRGLIAFERKGARIEWTRT